ncbi:MAG TPA: polyphenol oxidase family protein [Oligoflexia bacterium]|nr:polyphenol oxidase family protein [Oligoflexia bacterium]HMP27816.1 polyphenol oxidase family protein [Oligoflexia bacterium]
MGFELKKISEFEFLANSDLLSAGYLHGFGYGLHGENGQRDKTAARVAELLGLSKIFYFKQIHSDRVVDLSEGQAALDDFAKRHPANDISCLPEGDGWIITTRLAAYGLERYAFGVFSADCTTLLIKAGELVALLHAGWRGLANGIIKKALKIILEKNPSSKPPLVLLGSCAGPEKYEVGDDVLEAIGNESVYKEIAGKPSKYLLDMPAIVRKQIEVVCGKGGFIFDSVGLCTISDPRLYSARRQGMDTGRNITFWVV